jgi:hypothetical protein
MEVSAMTTLRKWIFRSAFLSLGLVVAAGSSASAGELYRWVTSDGTIAFTDDAKRIPKAYRGEAKRTNAPSLRSFARFSPVDAKAEAERAAQLEERLDYLRALNEPESIAQDGAFVAPGSPPVVHLDLRSEERIEGRKLVGFRNGRPVYRRTSRPRSVDEPVPSLALPLDPDSTEPVVVEKRRMFDSDSGTTRHVTVVQQGERILSIVKPRARAGSVDYELEESLER